MDTYAFSELITVADMIATAHAAAAARAQLAAETLCECGHQEDEHVRRGGGCGGRDSYGIGCTCPSHQRWNLGED